MKQDGSPEGKDWMDKKLSSRVSSWSVLLGLLAMTIACPLFMSASALAELSRPFRGSIAGPSESEHFSRPEAIAINPIDGGDVWIGDNRFLADESTVDNFSSSNLFLSRLAGLSTESLAFDDSTGEVYSAGGGKWIAADDSASLASGDVYIASKGDAEVPGSVQRYIPRGPDAVGEAANFTCSAPGSAEYIKGNELTGKPGESWGDGIRVKGVTVAAESGRSAGDIYVINNLNPPEVDQYESTGCFLRAFTDAEVKEGFGLYLTGVAVDPKTGDVLIQALRRGAIYEFSSSGTYLGQITGTSRKSHFGESALEGGLAVNSSGELYVADDEKNVVDIFGPGAIYPQVVTGETTNSHLGAVTLNGTVNDEGLRLTECYFEYVTEKAFQETRWSNLGSGGSVPCEPGAGQIPTDSMNHSVSAKVTALTPGTIYRYRLVAATNSVEPERGGTEEGESASFAAADAPSVAEVSARDISSSYADLDAEVNPLGSDTAYHFEYVEAANYDPSAPNPYSEGAVAPVSPADIGAGDRNVSIDERVGGLLPNTTYHFRVVATNTIGVTLSPDGTFTTLPSGSPELPDGRAYELLTPPNKGDAEDLFGASGGTNFDLGYSSASGNQFLLLTTAALGPFPASGENSYVFSRGEDGWSMQSLASMSLGVQSLAAEVYDPIDFSVVGVNDGIGPESALVQNLVGPPGGPYVNAASGTYGEPISMAGASLDLGHIVLEGVNHQLPLCESELERLDEEQDEGSNGLYEWISGRQCLSLVNVREGSLVSRCGAVLGQGQSHAFPGASHGAVSENGSKVFFTAPDPNASGFGCWENGSAHTPQVYLRVNGETTVEVSAPEPEVMPSKTYPAIYVGASNNGSKVFFVTRTELTKDAKELGTSEPELYEYNTDAVEGEKRLVRISGGESGNAEGGVLNVPSISADGSTVYFDAKGERGELAPGTQGPGLYAYDTETGKIRRLGPPGEYPAETPGTGRWYKGILNPGVVGLDVAANWYTTRNGQFLVFPSKNDISGYDSAGQIELYRYDAADGSTVCVSCDPNGAAPLVGAEFARSAVRADNPAGTPPRPISEDGSYVFFDTAESLVPQATNGEIDVYEWHNGTISLIGSGQDSANSFFLDSSEDGSNVFFGTHARLVPQDTDSEGDLYDARICTQTDPCLKPPVGETSPCEGDACQSVPPAPAGVLPGSLAFSGAGNLHTSPKLKQKSKPKTKRKSKKKKKTRRVKRRMKKAGPAGKDAFGQSKASERAGA